MNWFKCDDSGNILIDMHSILDLLQNIAIPQLGTKQDEILEAIQRIPVSDDEEGSGGISASQLGEILQAIDNIPSQELLDNQAELLAKLTDNSTKLGNIESTVNDIKTTSLPEIKGNQTTVLNKITDNTDKLSNMNNMLDTIYSSLEYSVEGVLRAGETSITLEDEHIKEGISVEIYTSICNVGPLSIESSDGSITLTFPEQEENMGVKVVFKRPIDWSNVSGGIDTSDATAVSNDVLSGKTAYVNGEKITGSMSSIETVTETLNCGESYNIPKGYHDGTGRIIANTANNQGLNNNVVTIDGEQVKEDLTFISSVVGIPESKLPYKFCNGSAVVYNNESHILGSGYNYTGHYKFDGSNWTEVSTLPYEFTNGSAVVYNNEIHILGGNYSNTTYNKHYKFDGSNWTEVSTLPYNFCYGSAVVYNNEIHILGSSYDTPSYTKHYKYNGTEWIQVSTLPYNFTKGSAVVYNNEIHILSGNGNGTKHYKYDGSTWLEVSTLPYNSTNGSAVVYNNEIHILGSGDIDNGTKHYKYNGSTWLEVNTLLYNFWCGSVVVYNDNIHVIGGSESLRNHYALCTLYKKVN